MISILAHAAGSGWLPLEMTPIHPILVNFTAALVPTSFAAELFGRWLRKPSLTSTAWWTLLLAATVTPLTVAAGWYWMRQMDMPGMDGRQMAIHKWLGISLAVLFIALTAWRGHMFRRDRVPSYGYLSVLMMLCALLTLQGHLGGVMSFGGGVSPDVDGDRAATTQAVMSEMPGIRRTPATNATASMPTTITTGTPMNMPMPSTLPASTPSVDADGWSDSIHVKRK
jgi:uncharacterized membrane protein